MYFISNNERIIENCDKKLKSSLIGEEMLRFGSNILLMRYLEMVSSFWYTNFTKITTNLDMAGLICMYKEDTVMYTIFKSGGGEIQNSKLPPIDLGDPPT